MTGKPRYCSFCGKNNQDRDVFCMVAHHDAYICNECVCIAQEIVIEARGNKEYESWNSPSAALHRISTKE